MSDLTVREATTGDAPAVCTVIHKSFGGRPPLDPPSSALAETAESVATALAGAGGLLCLVDGAPGGTVLFTGQGAALGLRRVGVVPELQSRGIASAMVGVAEEVAAARGYADVSLMARLELPATVQFWERRGYAEVGRDAARLTLAKALHTDLTMPDDESTQRLGRRLAALLRPGDVVLLTGDLGAGKTTLTRGIGAGLGVRGEVTSPTFVISRVHPSLRGGPALAHVDAYRLGDGTELDDLDLDALLEEAVTVVEWGGPVAEALSTEPLKIRLARRRGDERAQGDQGTIGDVTSVGAEPRSVTVVPVGARWVGSGLRSALLAAVASEDEVRP